MDLEEPRQLRARVTVARLDWFMTLLLAINRNGADGPGCAIFHYIKGCYNETGQYSSDWNFLSTKFEKR